MKTFKTSLLLLICGLLLGYLGAFFTGYTAAFVMPKSFAQYMWVWDALVVQFLGYGLLALAIGFIASKVSQVRTITVVLALFCVSQLYLQYPYGLSFYFPNIIVMLLCLAVGAACAKKYA